MCSRLATEAGAHQSCFMVPGEEAAGRKKALLGWVGSWCKTVAKLPHSSQPSWGGAFWQQDEELTFPFCVKMNSADFSKWSHRFYRLRTEAQVDEGAQPAVHHQACRETFCLLSSWQCPALRYQHSYSGFFGMLFVQPDRQLSCCTVWRVSFSNLLKRNVFLYCCMMERVIEAKQETVVSSGAWQAWKKKKCAGKNNKLSTPLGQKIPLFFPQNWLIPSQLNKSYIVAAKLVQDYFFQGSANWWVKICVFLAGETGKAEYVVNLQVHILRSLIAFKEATEHIPICLLISYFPQCKGLCSGWQTLCH